MGREFSDIDSFRSELNTALDMALETYVQDGAIKAIQESEEQNVYSYTPKWDPPFEYRRRENGGIKDKNNMHTVSDFSSRTEKSIEISIVASWEWLNPSKRYRGGPNPGGDLVETIENEGMYNAPPRPFMQEAETTYGAGEFETDLMRGLAEAGFDN